MTDTLVLGDSSGGSGTYNLSGGSLTVGDNETIGNNGSGAFTQSGGTNTVTGSLILGSILRRQRHLQPERRQLLASEADEYVGYPGTRRLHPERRHPCGDRQPLPGLLVTTWVPPL